jgi:hypothetical protein
MSKRLAMKSAEVSAEMKEELTALVPAERVTGSDWEMVFLVIYFDSNRKSDGVNRLVPPRCHGRRTRRPNRRYLRLKKYNVPRTVGSHLQPFLLFLMRSNEEARRCIILIYMFINYD